MACNCIFSVELRRKIVIFHLIGASEKAKIVQTYWFCKKSTDLDVLVMVWSNLTFSFGPISRILAVRIRPKDTNGLFRRSLLVSSVKWVCSNIKNHKILNLNSITWDNGDGSMALSERFVKVDTSTGPRTSGSMDRSVRLDSTFSGFQ